METRLAEESTMSKIVLMTDSASDISVENEKEYGIKIICFQHAFGDKTYVSRVDFNNRQYYEMLEDFDGIPSTSQYTPGQESRFRGSRTLWN